MVIMNTKQVKLVWATKPRPDGHVEMDGRRRVYATGIAIPRPLVRRRSFESKTRPTTLVIRREASAVKDAQPLDRSSTSRQSMTSSTLLQQETQRKPALTPSATKVTPATELKPILKTGKSTYEQKADDKSDAKTREALAAGLDNKFSYRLPDKPTVTKTKKSVSFKDADIGVAKVSRRQYSSPVYSVQYTGSVLKHEGFERHQVFV